MKAFPRRTGWLLLAVFGLLAATGMAAGKDPLRLVQETADAVLAEVTRHREELRKDNSLIYALVESSVLPHFDFRRMSRSAMGRYWRQASEAQQERIVEEFRELLVRTYAVALLGYTGQPIEYQPVRTDPRTGRVLVPTRIRNPDGGPPVPVNYRLYPGDDGWKVYDVVIDGVSLVTNYRSSFAAQIRRHGIDGLIGRLQQQNGKYRS